MIYIIGTYITLFKQNMDQFRNLDFTSRRSGFSGYSLWLSHALHLLLAAIPSSCCLSLSTYSFTIMTHLANSETTDHFSCASSMWVTIFFISYIPILLMSNSRSSLNTLQYIKVWCRSLSTSLNIPGGPKWAQPDMLISWCVLSIG